jgi:hypothetical protein
MSIIRRTTKVNDWVSVSYPGNSSDPVFLAFGNEEPTVWQPAFYEDGKALIRCPNIHPGSYFLWLKKQDQITKVAVVKVI